MQFQEVTYMSNEQAESIFIRICESIYTKKQAEFANKAADRVSLNQLAEKKEPQDLLLMNPLQIPKEENKKSCVLF